MSIAKITKKKQDFPVVDLPRNYDEFFEKKAAEMRIFLERNPVPEELLRRKK